MLHIQNAECTLTCPCPALTDLQVRSSLFYYGKMIPKVISYCIKIDSKILTDSSATRFSLEITEITSSCS